MVIENRKWLFNTETRMMRILVQKSNKKMNGQIKYLCYFVHSVVPINSLATSVHDDKVNINNLSQSFIITSEFSCSYHFVSCTDCKLLWLVFWIRSNKIAWCITPTHDVVSGCLMVLFDINFHSLKHPTNIYV
jgi:hypothetical protein